MITKNSTTITLTGTEQTVQFDRAYPYFWVQNLGDSDVLISMDGGIVEGADGVITVPAGGSCGTMHGYPADMLYLLGSGKVQIMGTGSAFNPFKTSWKGGVDVSLSKAGYAADSKVVGDKLKVLQDVINGVTHRFVTDNTTAYSKSVPAGAKIASVNRVGGMTIKQNDSLISAPVTAFNSMIDSRTIQTKTIPSGVLALEGYGDGINNDVYNYIKFGDRITFNQRVGAVDLGTLEWVKNQTLPRFEAIMPSNYHIPTNSGETLNVLCEIYTTNDSPVGMCYIDMTVCGYTNSQTIFIVNNSYTDTATFKAAMSGVMLYYELAEPIATDITDMFPADFNILDVMTDGKIVFENANKIAVPNEVEYIVDLAEVIAND